MDGPEFFDKKLEFYLDHQKINHWLISRATDVYLAGTKYPEISIMDQSFREKHVDVEEIFFRKSELSATRYNMFDSFLMIEDHRRLISSFLVIRFSVLDKYLCIDIVIRIAFEMTRCIREIDKKYLDRSPIFHIIKCREKCKILCCYTDFLPFFS
jgi:hypothetical protein